MFCAKSGRHWSTRDWGSLSNHGGPQIISLGRLMIIGCTEWSYRFRGAIYDEEELPGGLDGWAPPFSLSVRFGIVSMTWASFFRSSANCFWQICLGSFGKTDQNVIFGVFNQFETHHEPNDIRANVPTAQFPAIIGPWRKRDRIFIQTRGIHSFSY